MLKTKYQLKNVDYEIDNACMKLSSFVVKIDQKIEFNYDVYESEAAVNDPGKKPFDNVHHKITKLDKNFELKQAQILDFIESIADNEIKNDNKFKDKII